MDNPKTLEENLADNAIVKQDETPSLKNTSGIPDWIVLNNSVVNEKGNLKDLSKDKEAIKAYFVQHVNPNTRYFDTLGAKINWMVANNYWEQGFFTLYTLDEIKTVFNIAYGRHFKFKSYMAAFKFYNDYALKTDDKKQWLERYEDRLAVIALYHAAGSFDRAKSIVNSLINQDFVPATPTTLNSGRKRRGEFTSCFLINVNDSLNDISRALDFSMQLSKIGGGVGIDLTPLRARTEAIKDVKGAAKGVVGVAKLFDVAFRYADQMGQRQGAGAVYLNAFHADITEFLGMKKINADEDTRAKTLSIGVIVPDKLMELAEANKPMYLFYPHNIMKNYHMTFDTIGINMDYWYDILVADPNIRKREIDPRSLLNLIAQVQAESGYPYIMYADNVNRMNTNPIKVKFSNLCSEILQASTLSTYADYNKKGEDVTGINIACNLSSVNIAATIEHNSVEETVNNAMQVMTNVSRTLNIKQVPAIQYGNDKMHAVGLGAMNLHGFLAKNHVAYGSPESLDFVDVYFNMLNYYTLKWSMNLARETGETFFNFKESTYADGSYFEGRGEIKPKTAVVAELMAGVPIPTDHDWQVLKANVIKYGVYNSYRMAVAPNGSSSYIMSATAGVTPIRQVVEERTYGNSKTFYPEPYIETAEVMYQKETAYALSNRTIMNVIATIQKHVDQGISFELCIPSTYTTRDLIKDYIYAWHLGLKTIYYVRTNKLGLNADGTAVKTEVAFKPAAPNLPEDPEDCESCLV